MKSPLFKSAFYIAALGIATSSAVLRADSLTVEGDLNVDGKLGVGTNTPSEKLEVDGNAKVNGTLTTTGAVTATTVVITDGSSTSAPGLTLLYADETEASIYLNSPNAVNWFWGDETGRVQMKLGSDNSLTLFDQQATSQPGIVLDPWGETKFKGPVHFAHYVSFSNSVSVGGVHLNGDGGVIAESVRSMQVGYQNTLLAGNTEGMVFGFGNTAGGASKYNWEWATAILEGHLGTSYTFIVPGNHVATISAYNAANIYGVDACALSIDGIVVYEHLNNLTAIYDGLNTHVDLSQNLTGEWRSGEAGVMNLGWDVPRKAKQASAFGISNNVKSSKAFAFGIGNVVDVDDMEFDVVPLTGSGAYGINNVIIADNAYVLGNGITNDSVDTVQIGVADHAKIVIDGNGRLGVGLIEPSEKLDVNGSARVRGTVTAARIRVPASGGLSMGTFMEDGGRGTPEDIQ